MVALSAYYGSLLIVNYFQLEGRYYWMFFEDYRAALSIIFGGTVLTIGILIRTTKAKLIGYGLALGGALIIIPSTIQLVMRKPVLLRFVALACGIILLSYFIYKYREKLETEA